MEKIIIVQQNLDSLEAKTKRIKDRIKYLKNEGKDAEVQKFEKELEILTKENYDKYINKLMDCLLAKNPSVLFFSEFCFNDDETTIIKRLKNSGYKIVHPIGHDKFRDGAKPAACMLAFKKRELEFQIEECKEMVAKKPEKRSLRYIAGTLSKKKKKIKTFFTYVPQGPNIEDKAEMLLAAYCFLVRNKRRYIFLGGDFNSDIDGRTTRLLSIFTRLYDAVKDTGTKGQNTYSFINDEGEVNEKRLDYALVSKTLASKARECKTEVINTIDECKIDCGTANEPLVITADHRALCTTIKL